MTLHDLPHRNRNRSERTVEASSRRAFLLVSVLGVLVLGAALASSFLLVTMDDHDGEGVTVRGTSALWVANNFAGAGIMLLVYANLRRKGRSIDEAYRLGYDIGFENGYRSGREAREPVTPPGHRPVQYVGGEVVPFPSDKQREMTRG